MSLIQEIVLEGTASHFITRTSSFFKDIWKNNSNLEKAISHKSDELGDSAENSKAIEKTRKTLR